MCLLTDMENSILKQMLFFNRTIMQLIFQPTEEELMNKKMACNSRLKFIVLAEAYLIPHSAQTFQISLIYAFIGHP